MRDLKTRTRAPASVSDKTLKGQAAKRYRSQLDRIFAGGGLPDEIKRQAPQLQQVERGEQQGLIDAVLAATSPTEIGAAVDALLEAHPMPSDPELLAKVLAHPKQRHAQEALEQLLEVLESGRPANARLLKSRVQSVKMLAGDTDVTALADLVIARL